VPSVSWESQPGWKNILLVPDLYYFHARGYTDFLPRGSPELPEWSARDAVAFWRGQTTGLLHVTEDNLASLPRYRLCDAARRLGSKADMGITGVVQAGSAAEHQQIVGKLTREGLMRPFVPFREFATHKFVVDIDGNTNAWNFPQKLRLGACILKVESAWRQWMSNRLRPWQHYVPIAANLDDLERKVDWCLANDAAAHEIANNSREFALSLDFNDEMKFAAHQLLEASLQQTGVAPGLSDFDHPGQSAAPGAEK
jgi:Glycosyl transferase family 90